MWKPVLNQVGEKTSVGVRKMSNSYPTQCSHLPIKVEREQNWPELNPPPSQLGVGAFSQCRLSPTPCCWTPPGCVLLACRVLSHLGRVWAELCLHPSILPFSSPPPAMPSTHPQRRRRRLVTVAISEKPKLALLAVHRWQRHFAFLLIRKQNNMIKWGLSGGEWTNMFHK